MGLKEIRYISSADSTRQPAMFEEPGKQEAVPLLVALHTWSSDYRQGDYAACAQWCREKGWAFLQPNFRGPNNHPEATGSAFVVGDIISAVEFAKKNVWIDPHRIYLIGASGGGYTGLLMAGRTPELWTGVSAWVPIVDLKAWYFECRQTHRAYADDIVKSCGGIPGTSPAVDREYQNRSPITFLKNAMAVPLDINAGITDGHTGSVPIRHSLRAFNEVARSEDRISEEDINYFVQKAEVPPPWRHPAIDLTYGTKAPLFRRISGKARITIFNGGHEFVAMAGLSWLAQQCADTEKS